MIKITNKTMNKTPQRFALLKMVGLLYIAAALLVLAGGLWLGWTLYRADLYADYRRGAHLVAGFATVAITLLIALALFVQGNMAHAIAEIDRNTRANFTAIELARVSAEKAALTGQSAIRNSEAMLHAQSALHAAASDAAASAGREAQESAAAISAALDDATSGIKAAPVAAVIPPLPAIAEIATPVAPVVTAVPAPIVMIADGARVAAAGFIPGDLPASTTPTDVDGRIAYRTRRPWASASASGQSG